MGWYQDHFPGSPAAKQRAAISKGVVVYTIVASVAVFLFSPFARKVRKDKAEGIEYTEPQWFAERRETMKLSGGNLMFRQPTTEEMLNIEQDKDRDKRSDFSGPDIPEELLRRAM